MRIPGIRTEHLRIRSAFLATAFVCLLALGACAGPVAAGPVTLTASKKSITIVLDQQPDTLSPTNIGNAETAPIINNVYESLVTWSNSEKPMPALATSWKMTDSQTWQFQLRQGVTFSDGTKFDAQAAVDGLNYITSQPGAISGFPEGFQASAAGDYTLAVTTPKGTDPILPSELWDTPLPSPKQIKDDPNSLNTDPIGTGPYKVKSWTQGVSVVLVPNNNWWGDHVSSSVAGGSNKNITQVTFVARTDNQVATSMVKTGEAQLAPFLTSDECHSLQQCRSTVNTETIVDRLDTMNPVLKDIRIRKAIDMAINKKAILNQIMGGGEVSTQWAAPSAVGYDAKLKPNPYNPKQAKKLVAQAKADGVPVQDPLVVVARQGFILNADESVQLIASELTSIGLNVTSKVLEPGQFNTAYGMPYNQVSPSRGWITFHSVSDETFDAARNIQSYFRCSGSASTYCNPTFDAQVQAASQLQGAARAKAYQQIMVYLQNQVAGITIGRALSYYGMSKNIEFKPRIDALLLVKQIQYRNAQ